MSIPSAKFIPYTRQKYKNYHVARIFQEKRNEKYLYLFDLKKISFYEKTIQCHGQL